MKRQSSSRTQPSWGIPGHRRNSRDTIPFQEKRVMSRISPDRVPRIFQRGSVTMTVLLLLIIFSGLGLAMIHASGVHLKINGFRKFAILLDCASENGLKRGLRDLTEWLEAAGPLAAVAAERVAGLRKSPSAEFPRLLEDALGAAFPRVLEESFEEMT